MAKFHWNKAKKSNVQDSPIKYTKSKGKASEAQKRYMKSLGIEFSDNISKDQARTLIGSKRFDVSVKKTLSESHWD